MSPCLVAMQARGVIFGHPGEVSVMQPSELLSRLLSLAGVERETRIDDINPAFPITCLSLRARRALAEADICGHQ